MPGPDEVVDKWVSEDELLDALAADPLGTGGRPRIKLSSAWWNKAEPRRTGISPHQECRT